jgi:hypothetical protein
VFVPTHASKNAIFESVFSYTVKLCFILYSVSLFFVTSDETWYGQPDPTLLMSTKPRQRVMRLFHRNNVAAVEQIFRRKQLHGRRRTWHRNGQLATQQFFQNGLLDGTCSQWNEKGKMLGEYEMVHGTGTQKSWHDNGRQSQEFTTIAGELCGRRRVWLRDGTLIADEILLFGQPVSPDEYRQAMAKEPRLPKFRGAPAKLPPRNRAMEKHIHDVFVSGLLAKQNGSEARTWLKAGGGAMRSLGRFKLEGDALKFVEELYQAGAVKVIAPDIYQNKRGDQFADGLLVELPKAAAVRNAVRKAGEQLRSRRLGAVEPDKDIGEEFLLLSMA